jgi:hypothetical protein
VPVGFAHAARAYRRAAAELTAADLSGHYDEGRRFFSERFVPHVKQVLAHLSGGTWDLSGHAAFAAGTDVDAMAHVLDATDGPVAIYPGDWGGFLVGSTTGRATFTRDARGALACLCLPSVRNGTLTSGMLEFLEPARALLINVNLYPTLEPGERAAVARAVAPLLSRAILSVSFSRGFALTASQLGLLLVPPSRTLPGARGCWDWFTLFYNALGARAFMEIDTAEVDRVSALRREEVRTWHSGAGLPYQAAGSYYVKAFTVQGDLPGAYAPLLRDGVVRLCFKPAAE